MRSLKTLSILLLGYVVLSSSCRNNESTAKAEGEYVTVRPIEYEGALNNPLKGFRPRPGGNSEYQFNTIQRFYLKWNELERDEDDGVERIIQVCNEKWAGLAERNIKVIPRVYLDWDKNDGNEYWPEDMASGDYTSDQFKFRVERLITRLGKAWDNDPRVAWVQMGIIGYWGEHHHPKPNAWQEELLGNLFANSFKNKKVLVRRPFENFLSYDFGWYWDSFAHWDQIESQAESMMVNCPDRWKTAPIEGEVAYNWGNYKTQPGDTPSETLKDPDHRKWLISYIRQLHCTGLGWVAEYNSNDLEVRKGAEQVQKAFGYRYVLKEVIYPKEVNIREPFTVSIKVQNVGSAPFYYEWPVEICLLETESHEVIWKEVFKNIDIREWMPGDNWSFDSEKYEIPARIVENKETFKIYEKIPSGEYILALTILDPADMQPSVRFATIQHYNGGFHPVGMVGINKVIDNFELDDETFQDPREDIGQYVFTNH